MCGWHGAIFPAFGNYGVYSVKLAAMLVIFKRVKHFRNQIIYVKQFKLDISVIYRYGQIVRGIVAEGCHRAVIIWSAPFAEQIRKAVDKHLGSRFLGIFEKKLLPHFFASAILSVITPDKGRLNRA